MGDIKFVWDKEKALDDWLIVGGDNLFTSELAEFIQKTQSNLPNITIGVYDVGSLQEATQMGVVRLENSGKIAEFKEKPAQPQSTLIAMCLYYFPKDTLKLIADFVKSKNSTDAAGGYIQWLVGQNRVYGFQFKGRWYDIGSLESLKEAQEHFASAR